MISPELIDAFVEAAGDKLNGRQQVEHILNSVPLEERHTLLNEPGYSEKTQTWMYAVDKAAQTGSVETLEFLISQPNVQLSYQGYYFNMLDYALENDEAMVAFVTDPSRNLAAQFNDGTRLDHIHAINGQILNEDDAEIWDSRRRNSMCFLAARGHLELFKQYVTDRTWRVDYPEYLYAAIKYTKLNMLDFILKGNIHKTIFYRPNYPHFINPSNYIFSVFELVMQKGQNGTLSKTMTAKFWAKAKEFLPEHLNDVWQALEVVAFPTWILEELDRDHKLFGQFIAMEQQNKPGCARIEAFYKDYLPRVNDEQVINYILFTSGLPEFNSIIRLLVHSISPERLIAIIKTVSDNNVYHYMIENNLNGLFSILSPHFTTADKEHFSNQLNAQQETPRVAAIRSRNDLMFNQLYHLYADLNQDAGGKYTGKQLIHVAILLRNIEVIKNLIGYASTQDFLESPQQKSMIDLAYESGNEDIVELITQWRDSLQVDTCDDWMADTKSFNFIQGPSVPELFLAAQYNIVSKIPNLLSFYYDSSYDGKSPLAIAAQHGHIEVVKLILVNCLEPNEIVQSGPDEGKTPLYLAAEHNRGSVLKLLIESHADFSTPLIRGSAQGKTPLIIALELGHTAIVDQLVANNILNLTEITQQQCYNLLKIPLQNILQKRKVAESQKNLIKIYEALIGKALWDLFADTDSPFLLNPYFSPQETQQFIEVMYTSGFASKILLPTLNLFESMIIQAAGQEWYNNLVWYRNSSNFKGFEKVIISAEKSENHKAVDYLIENFITVQNIVSLTELACLNKQDRIIEKLIEKFGFLIFWQSTQDMLISNLVKADNLPLIKKLNEKYAGLISMTVKAKSKSVSFGDTPLSTPLNDAIASENLEIIDYLLPFYSDFLLDGSFKFSPIGCAAHRFKLEILDKIFDYCTKVLKYSYVLAHADLVENLMSFFYRERVSFYQRSVSMFADVEKLQKIQELFDKLFSHGFNQFKVNGSNLFNDYFLKTCDAFCAEKSKNDIYNKDNAQKLNAVANLGGAIDVDLTCLSKKLAGFSKYLKPIFAFNAKLPSQIEPKLRNKLIVNKEDFIKALKVDYLANPILQLRKSVNVQTYTFNKINLLEKKQDVLFAGNRLTVHYIKKLTHTPSPTIAEKNVQDMPLSNLLEALKEIPYLDALQALFKHAVKLEEEMNAILHDVKKQRYDKLPDLVRTITEEIFPLFEGLNKKQAGLLGKEECKTPEVKQFFQQIDFLVKNLKSELEYLNAIITVHSPYLLIENQDNKNLTEKIPNNKIYKALALIKRYHAMPFYQAMSFHIRGLRNTTHSAEYLNECMQFFAFMHRQLFQEIPTLKFLSAHIVLFDYHNITATYIPLTRNGNEEQSAQAWQDDYTALLGPLIQNTSLTFFNFADKKDKNNNTSNEASVRPTASTSPEERPSKRLKTTSSPSSS